jgi:hypothetical protein
VLSIVSTLAAFGFFAAQKIVRNALAKETELRSAAQSAATDAERERNVAQEERKTAEEERKKPVMHLRKRPRPLPNLESNKRRSPQRLPRRLQLAMKFNRNCILTELQ